MSDDNDSRLGVNSLIEVGSEISGNLAGAAIGFLLAGPPGAFAGAAATPLLTRTVRVAADFAKRQLSHREEVRVGATIAYASAKIQERLAHGAIIRQDDFFRDAPGDRATAEEIVEGVLRAAQRDHEERKLQFYGKLIANITFRPDIDRYQANLFIRLAQQMSYRELCLTAIFVRIKASNAGITSEPFRMLQPNDIVQDIYNLSQYGLISRQLSPISPQYIEDTSLGDMKITELCKTIHDLMELKDINEEDIADVMNPLLKIQAVGLGVSRLQWENEHAKPELEEEGMLKYTPDKYTIQDNALYKSAIAAETIHVRFTNNHVSYIQRNKRLGEWSLQNDLRELRQSAGYLIPLDVMLPTI
jgi:hypothetical protein